MIHAEGARVVKALREAGLSHEVGFVPRTEDDTKPQLTITGPYERDSDNSRRVINVLRDARILPELMEKPTAAHVLQYDGGQSREGFWEMNFSDRRASS